MRSSHSSSAPRGTTPAGHAATERPGDARIAAMQALVQKHFDANPEAEGAETHKKHGPSWKIPPKAKNKRKATNQVVQNITTGKVSETIRGTESKAMLWLKARMDKKKELEDRKKAAQAVKPSLAKSQPGLASAAKGLMGLSIRKPK